MKKTDSTKVGVRMYDISIPIKEGMVVYPNNPDVKFSMHDGATTTHTEVTFGTHTGTHMDAPRHALQTGQTVDNVPLEACFGPVRVLDFSGVPESVTVSGLEKYNIQEGERLLFKTSNSTRGFNEFYEDYVYLDGDAADYLAEKKVALVGIDYLSIKKKGDSDQRAHTSLLSKNIPIIEAIDLSGVEEGEYTLAAFPLKLKDLDGSPLRAVLIQQ